MRLREAQARVGAFMRAGGQRTRETPTEIRQVRTSELDMRGGLAAEEHNEWIRALQRGDLVEAYDAILDRIVIALGDAEALGLDVEEGLAEVLRSNDTKIDWDTGKPWAVRPDGKILKDEHFEPVDLGSIIEKARG